MKFQIALVAREGNRIPINYQYPVSAAIYKVLRQADDFHYNNPITYFR